MEPTVVVTFLYIQMTKLEERTKDRNEVKTGLLMKH